MSIKINDTEINAWQNGYPYWFHIKQGNTEISFTHKEALAISMAIRTVLNSISSNMSEKELIESGLR